MARTSLSRAFRRPLLAGLAIVCLSGAGLAAAVPAANATTPVIQPVGVTVSPITALTSAPVTATFTLTNPPANTGSVVAFSIVVPPGVGQVTAGAVSPPGGAWRELVVSCGGVPSCSSLVLVTALRPWSTSAVKPGTSLTASIRFTTPSSSTVLLFKVIGIGGSGLFTTTDSPTITIEKPIAGGVQALLTPGTPATLSDPSCSVPANAVCGSTYLGNGANGLVTLTQQACQGGEGGDPSICSANSGANFITSVQGDFSNLYTASSPASAIVTCSVTACPDTTPGEIPDFGSDSNTAEEIPEAIILYPGFAKSSAGDQPWVQLPACGPTVGNPNIIPIGASFCSDHNSYALDSSGNLSFRVYFLNDPKYLP